MIGTQRPTASLGAALLVAALGFGSATAKTAVDSGVASIVPKVGAQATNGILKVSFESLSGQWTLTTDTGHPHPNLQVLAAIGTSYITVRDATANIMYTNTIGTVASAGLAGYTTQSLNAPSGFTTPLGTTGFRTIYPVAGITIMQDVIINGTTVADTTIQQTVTITNVSSSPRQYGLRTMWDWSIGGVDNVLFRTRNPDTAFTHTFATYAAPTFQRFEVVDDPSNPNLTGIGTIGGSALTPSPTPPEQLRYASFAAAFGSAWDFPNTGAGPDSATAYYWGFNAPLTLAAGASASYTQYLITAPAAAGGGTFGPLLVPTMSQWGLLAMTVLLAACAMRMLRRREPRA